jgi:LMBR1 domain-containing protein 1
MNWWLILVGVISLILIIGVSIYFIVYYLDLDNSNNFTIFPSGVACFGLCLTLTIVLLLPFDIATRIDDTVMEYSSGIDTELMWQIVLWIAVAFILVIIPFGVFYYEAYDPDKPYVQIQQAFLYTIVLNFIFGGLTAILWVYAGVAEIPYYSYNTAPQFKFPDENIIYVQNKSIQILDWPVSIFVYVIALMALFGWLLFVMYGGVGLVSLPIDIFTNIKNRPKPITLSSFNAGKESLAVRAKNMLDTAKKLQNEIRTKNKSVTRTKINELHASSMEIEKEMENLRISYEEKGGSIIWYGFMIFIGFVSIILAILWIIHIFVFNLTGAYLFLNTFLISLDDTFSLLGIIAYAIFALHLLWSTIEGCIKVGMRILFFKIHPMEKGNTQINSILFNVDLILLTSITVTHFCGQSFRFYASNTAIYALLNVYVRNLRGLGAILFYLQFLLVAIIFFSIFWVCLCPKKNKKKYDKLDDEIA